MLNLKIDETELYDDFFEDVIVLGIVVPVRDYMFIWHMNNLLSFRFRQHTEAEIRLNRKKREYTFNLFEYCVPFTTIRHLLYENQHDGEYLLPEFKHLDFIWVIKEGNFSREELDDFLGIIKMSEKVQMVTEIPIEKIKSKENLLY